MFDPNVYDEGWFDYLSRFDADNERAFHAVLALLGTPASLLDVGCGTSYVVRVADNMGIMATGVELPAYEEWSPFEGHLVVSHDLREPLDLLFDYDLVLSWEVAEHLPEESADTYCDTLARHTGKWLVLTAAHENQGGDWHLNEQPQSYWIEKLEARGLKYCEQESMQLGIIWKYTTGPMHWLPDNVMIFKKEDDTCTPITVSIDQLTTAEAI